MTVQLSSLRVSADLDPAKYTAGANAKVAADKAMVASSTEVGQAISQTDQKISRAGDVLSRLSRQYVDGYAAAQRMNGAINQLARGIETGKISMQQAEPILEGIYRKYGQITTGAELMERGQYQLAAAITATNAKMAQQQGLIDQARRPAAANQNMGSYNTANIAAQFQDVAVTSAMGMSPLQIALQQGSQLSLVFEQMKASGQSAGSALLSAFTGIISPISLITIGLTGAAAVAIQFFSSAEDGAKSLEDRLEAHIDLLDKLADGWEKTENAVRGVGRESQRVVAFQSQQAVTDLRSGFNSGVADLVDRLTYTPSRGGTAIYTQYSELNAEIQKLLQQARDGTPDVVAFNEALISKAEGGSEELKARIADILKFAGSIAAAQRAVQEYERNVGPGGLIRGGSEFNRRDMEAYEEFRREEARARREAQAQFEAEISEIRARSPQERAAAAMARERAVVDDNETAGMRRDRIELAGKRALIEAEHELTEAQRERMRSLDATIESARLDIELVGKSTAETERLRKEHELLAQVREEAARNGVEADEAEIARIREKAAEYGRLRALEEARSTIRSQQDDLETKRAEMSVMNESATVRSRVIEQLRVEQEIRRLGIPLYGQEANAMRANAAALSDLSETMARNKLQQDLMFERQQILRSSQDQQIASMLRGAGLPIDFGSQEAQMIRYNLQLSDMKDTFKGFFTDMAQGLRDGKSLWESFADAAINALSRIADRLLDTALDNIFGALFGGGSQTSSGGGFNVGGLLGMLFGGGRSGGSTSTFQANTTLSDFLGLGSAPLGNVTRMPLAPIASNDNFFAPQFLSGIGSPGSLGLTTQLASRASMWRDAIASIESVGSGGYAAIGPTHATLGRALGRYQVMEANIGPWSQAALGRRITSSEFLANPRLQDQIFDHRFGGYVDQYGEGGAASMWFTGRPSAPNARDVLGTSGSQYVNKFNAQMEKLSGSVQSATASMSTIGVSGLQVSKSLIDAAGGLTNFGGMLSSFMSSSMGGGSSWFQGLMGMFGGAGGALGYMSSISPGATAAILGAGGGFVGLYEKGAAFQAGNVIPFARGDVLYGPTYFPMSAGRTGLMGEAGPEAIMPLRRTSDGRLGVAATGGERGGFKGAAEFEGRPMNFYQSNTFVLPSAPETPKSQNQIAAKTSEVAMRFQRTA